MSLPAGSRIVDVVEQMRGAVKKMRGAAARIATNANAQSTSLRDIVISAKSAVGDISRTVSLITRARQQTASTESTIGEAAKQCQELTQSIRALAATSKAGIDPMVELLTVSRKIDDVVGFVREVAEQTNLLALNASIEAARAGQHGRGFAVVASEIRRLAESTRTATRQMDGLMTEIRRRAEKTADISTRLDEAVTQSEGASQAAEAALSSISLAFEDVVETFATVEAAIEEQAARSEQHGATAERLLQTARQHFADSAESELSINAIEFHSAQVQALSIPRSSGGPISRLRVGFATSIDSLPGRTLTQFKKLLEARTGRAIEVVLDSGYAGGQLACMRDVRLGEIALTSVNCSIVGNLIPSAQLVELPYLFESREHAFRLLDSEYGRVLLTAVERYDLLGLGYIENGMRQIANSKQVVRKPADLNEMRMRTLESPIHIFIADALHTFPTPIPMPKLYKAVESREVDGQDNPLPNFLAMELWRVQQYLTLTAHSYSPQVVLANREIFEELGEHAQAVDEALQEALAWHRKIAAEIEANALAELQRKIEVHWPTAQERQAFIEATAPVYARAAALVGDDEVSRIRSAARAAGAGLSVRSA